MATPEKLQTYLSVHISYELLMLRYTVTVLNKPISQLSGYAHYESFVIHARNLYDFLIAESKKNSNNFTSIDYGASKASKGEDYQIFNLIDPQVMHMAKLRLDTSDNKINLEKVNFMANWVEANFSKFLSSKDSKYTWDNAAANPPNEFSLNDNRVYSITGPVGPITN